jgi:ABC-type nickel/cobalt efflux system permease component RcnA
LIPPAKGTKGQVIWFNLFAQRASSVLPGIEKTASIAYKPFMVPDISYIPSADRSLFRRFLPIFLVFGGVAWGLFFVTLGTAQANPFTQKNANPVPQHQDDVLQPAPRMPTSPTPGQADRALNMMERIIVFQMKIKKKMTVLIRQAKETGKAGPLLWVLAAGFVYGMVHSAGPGHGKALALSYIVSIKPTLPRALAFGNILAISHGMSGAVLVFCVKYLLQASMSGTLASVTRTTQIASYSLIIVLGLFLFLRKLPVLKKIKPKNNMSGEDTGAPMDAKSILPAVFIGMIPCPGVVLSVLFCLSLGLPGFGMMLAFAITIGMASTLSLVVLAAMAGKAALLVPLSRRFSFAHNAGDILEAVAGIILSTLSLMLLITVLNT